MCVFVCVCVCVCVCESVWIIKGARAHFKILNRFSPNQATLKLVLYLQNVTYLTADVNRCVYARARVCVLVLSIEAQQQLARVVPVRVSCAQRMLLYMMCLLVRPV